MASADFSTDEEFEQFEPLQRAKDRLALHIFKNYDVMPEPEELSNMVIEILPYVACHLALFHANEATEEIVRRGAKH